MGPQCSAVQLEKILGYVDVGRQEGAKYLTASARAQLDGMGAD
jgi:aldehyde dehydrogenase